MAWAPRVNISARTGRHLERLVAALELALDSWDSRIPTGKFNALIAELVAEHPHPVRGGRQPRILFGTQASTRPPTFVLFTTGFLDPGTGASSPVGCARSTASRAPRSSST